ncbi:MAG: sulfite exporter TauE/SafE family protein [Lysobacterales bacterium]|jgi:sulfite exporter TauE/SafE
MSPEIAVLSLSAAVIAFTHTVLGPDHYLPFIAMARARNWSTGKSLRITLLCGIGHLLGSVVLGMIGIFAGTQLASLEWLEGLRGNLAAWLLAGFGLAYLAWGIRQAVRNRPHRHWHSHDGFTHSHVHSHHEEHAHLHEQSDGGRSITPWVIFVIFVLGPCEPLIPLLMYPAARESFVGVLMVTFVFGTVTVLTMLGVVGLALRGMQRVRLPSLERYVHAMAGATVLACGLAMIFLGI